MLLHKDGPGRTSWRKLEIGVEDRNADLTGRSLRLDWEGDGTVIEVYSDPGMTQRIHSGDTWDIGQIEYLYVKALAAGSTELVLTLEEPLTGRPLSDVVAINIT